MLADRLFFAQTSIIAMLKGLFHSSDISTYWRATGLKIATDMVANTTNISSLATKSSDWVSAQRALIVFE